MKYFTMSWWNANQAEDDPSAVNDYARYLESILDSLPPDLYRLAVDVRLHDARLRRLHLAGDTLELQIDGVRYQNCGGEVRLTYRAIHSFTSTADPEIGLAGPPGYGHLGYHEIEVIEPGVYEHRILFSSGIELQVRFSELSVWCEGDAV
jgi:hypothetical protein